MSDTKIICGFSGTLKSTISHNYMMDEPNSIFIESPTKFMHDFNERVGGDSMEITPMHGLMMRFWQIEKVHDTHNLIIERSIYDYAFFSIESKVPMFDKLTDFNFRELNSREWKLVGDRDYYLIINKADNFIQNYILKDSGVRSHMYSTLDEYYDLQNKYMEFVGMFINPIKTLTLTDGLVEKIFNHELKELSWL